MRANEADARPAGGPDRSPSARLPGRKRRRWLRRAAIALAVLVPLLVGLLPYLASTDLGAGLIASALSGRFKGAFRIEDLSLSWFGPTRAGGLELADPEGRRVLRAAEVVWPGGVWRAIRSPQHFAGVKVSGAEVVLYEDPGGGFSLARSLEATAPPAEPGPLPQPVGDVTLSDGLVRVTRLDGRSWQGRIPHADLEVNTLNRIRCSFRLATPGAGGLSGRAVVEGLAAGGAIRRERAAGTVEIVTEGPVELAPAGEFLLARPGIGGTAQLAATISLKDGQVRGELREVLLRGLQAGRGGPGTPAVRPLDLALAGEFRADARQVEAALTLTWEGRRLTATGRAGLSPGRPWPEGEQVLSALLAGRGVELPDFSLRADGQVDLAALMQAVPALLNVRADAAVTGGLLSINAVAVSGGPRPGASGEVKLTGLTVRRQGRSIELAPIVADLGISTAEDGALKIDRALLVGSGVEVKAGGSPMLLGGGFQADLTRLQEQWDEVFEPGPLRLAGKAAGQFRIERKDGSAGTFHVDATGESLRCSAGAWRLRSGRVGCVADGSLELAGGRLARAAVTSGKVTVEDKAAFDLAGGAYDRKQGSYALSVRTGGADLAALAEMVSGPGLEPLARLAGRLELNVAVRRDSAAAPVQLTCEHFQVADLTLDRRPLGTLRADWSGATLSPQPGSVRIARLRASVPDKMALTVHDVHVPLADPLASTGRVEELSADLDWCLAAAEGAVRRVAEWTAKRARPPRLDGRLTATGSCRQEAGRSLVSDVEVRIASPGAGAGPQPRLALKGGGWFKPADGGFHAEAGELQCDLAYVGLAAAELGYDRLAGYSGRLEKATLAADRAAGGGGIVTSGGGILAGLRAGGKPLTGQDVTFRWTGARLAAAERLLEVAHARLDAGETAAATAGGVRCEYGRTFTLSGDLEAAGDLAGCLAAAAPLAGWKDPPALAGAWNWKGAFRTAAGRVSLDGGGGVKDLQVGAGEKAYREKFLRLSHKAVIDNRARTITLEQAGVESESDLFSATAKGTVADCGGRWELALSGSYAGSWERITALLHRLAPRTAEEVAVTGRLAGAFAAAGPAYLPTRRPVFGGVTATAELDWESAVVYGQSIGRPKGGLRLTLKDGVLSVPASPIPASQGELRPGVEIDFRGERPVLRNLSVDPISAERREAAGGLKTDAGLQAVLDMFVRKVPSQDDLLSRINPFLLGAEGKVSLMVWDVSVPLGGRPGEGAAGGGYLDLADVRLKRTDELNRLITLAGLLPDALDAVQIKGPYLKIEKERIHYRDLTMIFAKVYDPKFRGSVGFDESVDLTISLPLRPALLSDVLKLDKGLAAEIAKALDGLRIDIPLKGTRLAPKLDLSILRPDNFLKFILDQLRQRGGAGLKLIARLGGLLPPDSGLDKLIPDLLRLPLEDIFAPRKKPGE